MPSRSGGRGYRAILVLALVVTVAAGAYYGWGAYRSKTDRPLADQRPAAPVVLQTIARGAFPVRIDSIGAVLALNNVALRTRVDGQIEQAFFKEGETVKAGDLLIRIDARPFKAALDQALAKRAQDQATLDNAKRDLDRYTQLAAKKFATEQQLNTQQATVASGTAQMSADDAAIENARTQLSYTEIRAPISGRIGFRQVDVGNIVHAGDSQPVLSIVQVDPIFVLFAIPENRIYETQQALSAHPLDVEVYNGDRSTQLAQGELTVLNNQVDQASGTLQAKATFANPDLRLWPGQSVVVSLHVRDLENVTLAPEAAVQRGPNGLYVWALDKDDTVAIRAIETTMQDARQYVVTSGLSPGDRVVVAGQTRLYDHARVAVTEAPREQTSSARATRTQ